MKTLTNLIFCALCVCVPQRAHADFWDDFWDLPNTEYTESGTTNFGRPDAIFGTVGTHNDVKISNSGTVVTVEKDNSLAMGPGFGGNLDMDAGTKIVLENKAAVRALTTFYRNEPSHEITSNGGQGGYVFITQRYNNMAYEDEAYYTSFLGNDTASNSQGRQSWVEATADRLIFSNCYQQLGGMQGGELRNITYQDGTSLRIAGNEASTNLFTDVDFDLTTYDDQSSYKYSFSGNGSGDYSIDLTTIMVAEYNVDKKTADEADVAAGIVNWAGDISIILSDEEFNQLLLDGKTIRLSVGKDSVAKELFVDENFRVTIRDKQGNALEDFHFTNNHGFPLNWNQVVLADNNNVPEPSTRALSLLSLSALAARRRRRA